MRILVDTALLLNDYFHRNPDRAAVRGGAAATPELLAMWQASHEALLALSLRPATFVCLAEYSVLRMASVLSDLHLASAEVLEELRYWNANFLLLALSPGEAETALEIGLEMHPTPPRPADDYILAHLAARYEADYILTPLPRAANRLGIITFVTPTQMQDLLVG